MEWPISVIILNFVMCVVLFLNKYDYGLKGLLSQLRVMSRLTNLPSFMVSYLFLSKVFGLGCPYKGCNCDGNTISCAFKDLTSIPPVTQEKYSQVSLLFDGNKITRIKAGDLLANMSEISFWSNPITTIENTAFNGSATTLQILRFSNALFTKIPDAFSHLRALTDLSLSSMNITDWNEVVMKNFNKTLNKLYLDDVGLTTWPKWIQAYSRVTDLSVVSGSITTLPDNAFDNLTNSLISLTLYNNSLNVVPKALSKLTALQTLYLQENKITNLTWLPKTSSLSSLSLNSNNLHDAGHISDSMLHYAESLSFLNLYSNLLTAIPRLDFLTKISNQDLTNNLISDSTSGSMSPAILGLNLANNRLTSIPRLMSTLDYVSIMLLSANYITKLEGENFPPSTTTVNLDYNHIEEVTETSIPKNSSIIFLNLNNNPLTKISSIALQNLPLLREIHLANTKLTRLPLGLPLLTKLNILDLSGINHLVCTCAEKSLGPWIKKLYSYDVEGQCGLMSVYDFFVTLSFSCPH